MKTLTADQNIVKVFKNNFFFVACLNLIGDTTVVSDLLTSSSMSSSDSFLERGDPSFTYLIRTSQNSDNAQQFLDLEGWG